MKIIEIIFYTSIVGLKGFEPLDISVNQLSYKIIDKKYWHIGLN